MDFIYQCATLAIPYILDNSLSAKGLEVTSRECVNGKWAVEFVEETINGYESAKIPVSLTVLSKVREQLPHILDAPLKKYFENRLFYLELLFNIEQGISSIRTIKQLDKYKLQTNFSPQHAYTTKVKSLLIEQEKNVETLPLEEMQLKELNLKARELLGDDFVNIGKLTREQILAEALETVKKADLKDVEKVIQKYDVELEAIYQLTEEKQRTELLLDSSLLVFLNQTINEKELLLLATKLSKSSLLIWILEARQLLQKNRKEQLAKSVVYKEDGSPAHLILDENMLEKLPVIRKSDPE